jgi:hypothetical protein
MGGTLSVESRDQVYIVPYARKYRPIMSHWKWTTSKRGGIQLFYVRFQPQMQVPISWAAHKLDIISPECNTKDSRSVSSRRASNLVAIIVEICIRMVL